MSDQELIKQLKEVLSEACMDLGKNTAHDYDGIETNEDILIYTKSIIRTAKENTKP